MSKWRWDKPPYGFQFFPCAISNNFAKKRLLQLRPTKSFYTVKSSAKLWGGVMVNYDAVHRSELWRIQYESKCVLLQLVEHCHCQNIFQANRQTWTSPQALCWKTPISEAKDDERMSLSSLEECMRCFAQTSVHIIISSIETRKYS